MAATAGMELAMLSPDDLAEMLSCTTRHLARLDVASRIPAAVKLGRLKRWVTSEIRSWMAAGCPLRADWERIKSKASPAIATA